MTIQTVQDDDTYKGRIDLRLWRRILTHAAPYRAALLTMCIAGVFVAGIDVLFPLVTGWLIDEAIENGLTDALYGYGAAYLALVIGLTACIWLFIVFAGRIATGIAYDLRTKGFARLQELSFSFYDVRPVGWLVSRITSDCEKISSLIPWFMLDLVWGTLFIVGLAGAMFWLNWMLALAVLAIVPPLAIASAYFQSRLLESSRHMRKTNAQLTATFGEALMGVKTTKALVRERDNLEEFQVVSGSMYRHSMRNSLQSAVYLPLVITIGALGTGLALWQGGVLIRAGELTLGTLIAFMQYAALLSMPIQELARRFTDLQAAQAAAERVQGLLDTEPEIKDSPEVLARMNEARKPGLTSEARKTRVASAAAQRDSIAIDGYTSRIETIEFRNVSFWYGKRTAIDSMVQEQAAADESPVLAEFNFTATAGQTIALVGATGGGKSTIVSLLARFYEPQQGEILINGIDYRKRSLHWLQSQLGIVLQTPFLFSGTVRENIRYGRLNASDEEVERAAMVANAHDFIMSLDAGYETEIGEGGGRLSTGQRQLVSLARAVLANPQIFIMDEATSSVDTETERLIQDGIGAVLRGRISFVIAHRLSTIRAADVILVIDGGRIVEQGSHMQLLAQNGRYHGLYTRQFASEEEERTLVAGK